MSDAEPKSTETSNDPAIWPDSLDAMVAAPEHHILLLENERVRVLRAVIPAGERTAVHTRRWPSAMYFLQWNHFLRYDDNDNLLVDSREVDAFKTPPEVLWSGPTPPHFLLNPGDSDLDLISVELKEAPSAT